MMSYWSYEAGVGDVGNDWAQLFLIEGCVPRKLMLYNYVFRSDHGVREQLAWGGRFTGVADVMGDLATETARIARAYGMRSWVNKSNDNDSNSGTSDSQMKLSLFCRSLNN